MPLDGLVKSPEHPGSVTRLPLERETSLSKNMSVSSEMFTIFFTGAGLRLLDIQFYSHGLSHPSYICTLVLLTLVLQDSYHILSYSPRLRLSQLVVALLTSTLYTSPKLYHLVNNSSLLGKMARFASLSKLTLTFQTVTKSTCSVLEDPSSSFVSNISSTPSYSDQIPCIS